MKNWNYFRNLWTFCYLLYKSVFSWLLMSQINPQFETVPRGYNRGHWIRRRLLLVSTPCHFHIFWRWWRLLLACPMWRIVVAHLEDVIDIKLFTIWGRRLLIWNDLFVVITWDWILPHFQCVVQSISSLKKEFMECQFWLFFVIIILNCLNMDMAKLFFKEF